MSKAKSEREITRDTIRDLFLAICIFAVLTWFIYAPYFIAFYHSFVLHDLGSLSLSIILPTIAFLAIFSAGILFDRLVLRGKRQ